MSVIFSSNLVIAIAALTVAAFGILTTVPLFWNLPTANLRGPAAAAGIAVINSFGCLAGFASPCIVGILKDLTKSTNVGMYCIAFFCFLVQYL